MSKRKVVIGVLVLVLLGVGMAWAFRNRTDPQVEKVKQLQAEAFKEGGSPEQRRQNFELIHQEMEKLTPEQRHEVGREMHQNFERRMDQQIKDYFALSTTQERTAYLDKQIDEWEKRSKEMQKRFAQNGGQNRQGGPGALGGGGPGGQGGGSQAGPGQGGPGGPPPGGNSADARMQRRDARLDRSTALQRSQRSEYFADLRARRIQRGLPANPFPAPRPR